MYKGILRTKELMMMKKKLWSKDIETGIWLDEGFHLFDKYPPITLTPTLADTTIWTVIYTPKITVSSTYTCAHTHAHKHYISLSHLCSLPHSLSFMHYTPLKHFSHHTYWNTHTSRHLWMWIVWVVYSICEKNTRVVK